MEAIFAARRRWCLRPEAVAACERCGYALASSVVAIEKGRRTSWTGDGGMVLDFLEHDYSNDLLQGHCIPGGMDDGFVSCTDGGSSLHWGEVVLEWFINHPQR